jgi:hypothetical protein
MIVPYHGCTSAAHDDLDVDTMSKNGEHTSFSSRPFHMNVLLLSKDGHAKSHASYFDGHWSSIPKYSDKWACDYCQVVTFATFQEVDQIRYGACTVHDMQEEMGGNVPRGQPSFPAYILGYIKWFQTCKYFNLKYAWVSLH